MEPTTTPPEFVIQRMANDLAQERVHRANAEARVDYLEHLLAQVPEAPPVVVPD